MGKPGSQSAGVVTLLFTDLVGSTEMLARLGDDAAEELRQTHFRLLRERRPEVVEYQVRQTPRGAVIPLCCRAPLDTGALGSEVADALRRLGLASPDVSVAVVESLPRQAAGKLKRFVPLLAPHPSPAL